MWNKRDPRVAGAGAGAVHWAAPGAWEASWEEAVAAGAKEVANLAAVVGVGWATEAVWVVAWVSVATAAAGWLEATTAAATEVVRLAATTAAATEARVAGSMDAAAAMVAVAPRGAEEILEVKEEFEVDAVRREVVEVETAGV